MDITTLLIVWLVTAVSLWIISKLVLGIITALVKPVLKFLFVIPNLATFDLLSGIFTFMIAVACFSIAAWLVDGFRLRFGIWSAILGAFALTLVNNIIYKLLGV